MEKHAEGISCSFCGSCLNKQIKKLEDKVKELETRPLCTCYHNPYFPYPPYPTSPVYWYCGFCRIYNCGKTHITCTTDNPNVTYTSGNNTETRTSGTSIEGKIDLQFYSNGKTN